MTVSGLTMSRHSLRSLRMLSIRIQNTRSLSSILARFTLYLRTAIC